MSLLLGYSFSSYTEFSIVFSDMEYLLAYFVKLVGSNVNLGNIAMNEIIPLETIRLGLRGDTFATFLPEDIKKEYKLGKYYQDDRIRQND